MKKTFLLLLVGVVGCITAAAQSRNGLCINEVMVSNENSVVDEYGEHSAWIELFNSTYAPLEISSVYITTERINPGDTINRAIAYAIPLGDVNTRIPKRQHIIFWVDNKPTRGTFHTNFELKAGEVNYVAIYDADRKTLIDAIEIPANLQPGESFARKADGIGGINNPKEWEVRNGQIVDGVEKYITPSSNNIIKDTNTKVETFHKLDKSGVALTVMAMAIVFTALLGLCICFMIISKLGARINRANKIKSQGITPKEVDTKSLPDNDSGEVIAAIGMALHEHLNAHDTEQTILTISKVKKTYSPWSSKIYSMRELPKR